MSGQILKWSNSSLTTLQQCGEKFRRRYIERERMPSSASAVAGGAVHKVARTALMRKMTDHTLPSVAEARDLAATEFAAAWREGVQLTPDEIAEGAGSAEGRAKDFAVDLSGYHVQAVAPAINPIGIERKIVVKPKDSDIEINGVIDLIDQRPDGEVIRDLKTSKKSPNKDAADSSQQLTLYALIRKAEVGRLPSSLSLDYLVRTPARGELKHIPLFTVRDEEDVRGVVNRINTAVEAVKRGVFVPANPDAWWCSRSYCEYFATCPYVRRGADRPLN